MREPPKKLYKSLEEEIGTIKWVPKELLTPDLKKVEGILVPQDYSQSGLGMMIPFHAFVRLILDKENVMQFLKGIKEGENDDENVMKIFTRANDGFFDLGLSPFNKSYEGHSWGQYETNCGWVVNPYERVHGLDRFYRKLYEGKEIAFLSERQALKIWEMPHRDPTIVFHW